MGADKVEHFLGAGDVPGIKHLEEMRVKVDTETALALASLSRLPAFLEGGLSRRKKQAQVGSQGVPAWMLLQGRGCMGGLVATPHSLWDCPKAGLHREVARETEVGGNCLWQGWGRKSKMAGTRSLAPQSGP